MANVISFLKSLGRAPANDQAQEVAGFRPEVAAKAVGIGWRPLRELNPGRRNDNPA